MLFETLAASMLGSALTRIGVIKACTIAQLEQVKIFNAVSAFK